MNVVVVVCDTLRFDHLGCNGNDWIRTPALDAFAREATVFEEAVVGSFPTVPVRQDLFTGRWGAPFQRWEPLAADAVTLPGHLRDNGYVTMLLNDTPHLINFGFGFDRPFHGWDMIRGNEVDRWRTVPIARGDYPADPRKLRDPETFAAQTIRNGLDRRREDDYCSPRLFSAGMRWLEENRGHERFFLWIDSFDPHEPWGPPRHYVDLYDPGYEGDVVTFPVYGSSDYLSPEELRHMRALYAAEVTMVDRWLGRLLEKLRDLRLDRTTAVVVASDHGFMHGEHGLVGKGDFYREVSRLVLMVRHPEGRGAGRRSRALVQPVDLFPSVVEMVGLPAVAGLDGVSWCPAFEREWSGREAAFSGNARSLTVAGRERTHVHAYDGRWALLDHPNEDYRELYDLSSDPAQTKNVAARERAVADRLHGALVDFYRSHDASADELRLLTGETDAQAPSRPAGDTHEWVREQLARRNFLVAGVLSGSTPKPIGDEVWHG